MKFSEREQLFVKDNGISIKDAIDRVNKRCGEQIDYAFLQGMYGDTSFGHIAEEAIQQLQSLLQETKVGRDNFLIRVINKMIPLICSHKRSNDDTRISKLLINQEVIINNLLTSPTKFNPIAELNSDIDYPLIYTVSKEFMKINKEHIIKEYYSGSRSLKRILIKNGHERLIDINRDMVGSLILKLYPFVIRREIQSGNLHSLAIQ